MPLADAATLAARATSARRLLADRRLDGLIVTALPNISYLTTFRGSSAIVLLTADAVHFVTDFRYVATVEALGRSSGGVPGLRLSRVETSYDEALASLIGRLGLQRVGFEAAHMSVARYNWLAAAVGGEPATGAARLEPVDRAIERLRLCKDPSEVATLRAAARLLSEVAAAILPTVRAGCVEREVAATIDGRMHRAGFERPAFETIVASGPNAGLPHARPGARRLEAGDLVVLDFGGVYDGYCVDLTRMVSIGTAQAEQAAWHAAVLAAQAAAIEIVRPGVLASDVDMAARAVLEARGFGEAFGHGTGHGLGLEVHEEPRVSRARPGASGDAATDPGSVALESGMVFTVEPGVYLPGRGGVRIEDDVLVTRTGCEVLTNVPRMLAVSA